MNSAVSAFFTLLIQELPDFLMAHPVIDVIAIAITVWVISLVARLLSGYYTS